ncbi:hypothetical protein Esti_005358 [Eimeria stiedai]
MALLKQRRVSLLLGAACLLVERGSSVSLQQRSSLEASETRRGNATPFFLGISEADHEAEGWAQTADAANTASALQQASFSLSSQNSASGDGVSSSGNPWGRGIYGAFMAKFNIPVSHGSGVFVDLGKESGGYRQVSGRCPVFGKYIKLLKSNATTMTFLQDYPASGSNTRPLPGGFNLSYVSSSGRKVSPIKDSFISSVLEYAGPQTPIGRCARYAYLTHARKAGSTASVDYKMPFVYDSSTGDCYVLHVSMQQLKGSRYCSTNGDPAGLVWPCFHPAKSSTESAHLVYGSAYMGESVVDPDGWKTKCPTHAVRGALFGHWKYGACLPVDARSTDVGAQSVAVNSKQECWEQVFSKSASDETVASNPGNWDSVVMVQIMRTFILMPLEREGSVVFFLKSQPASLGAPTTSRTPPSGHLMRKSFHLKSSNPELEEAEEAAVVEEVKAAEAAAVVKAAMVKAAVVKAVVVKAALVQVVEEEDQQEAKAPAGAPVVEVTVAVATRESLAKHSFLDIRGSTRISFSTLILKPLAATCPGIFLVLIASVVFHLLLPFLLRVALPDDVWTIAGGVVGGLILLAAIGGGVAYFRSGSAGAPAATPEHAVDGAGGAAGRSPNELNVQPEESFWKGEAVRDGSVRDVSWSKRQTCLRHMKLYVGFNIDDKVSS